jgi:hypothetical protein
VVEIIKKSVGPLYKESMHQVFNFEPLTWFNISVCYSSFVHL